MRTIITLARIEQHNLFSADVINQETQDSYTALFGILSDLVQYLYMMVELTQVSIVYGDLGHYYLPIVKELVRVGILSE